MDNATTGMSAVVSTMTSELSAAKIWGVFGELMPFIATLTLVGLGAYLIQKYLRKARKMKN